MYAIPLCVMTKIIGTTIAVQHNSNIFEVVLYGYCCSYNFEPVIVIDMCTTGWPILNCKQRLFSCITLMGGFYNLYGVCFLRGTG
jgi:hypothetical protein